MSAFDVLAANAIQRAWPPQEQPRTMVDLGEASLDDLSLWGSYQETLCNSMWVAIPLGLLIGWFVWGKAE